MTASTTLGVAFLSNSDSMTGFLGQEVTKLIFELNENVPGADVRNRRRVAAYRDQNAGYLASQRAALERARAQERWKGWTWHPTAAELAAFDGRYERKAALLPEADVEVVDGSLFLRHRDLRYRLTPAAPDLFGAQTYAFDEIAAIAFVRGTDGSVVALDWDGNRYDRR
jgi:hypothetical protein